MTDTESQQLAPNPATHLESDKNNNSTMPAKVTKQPETPTETSVSAAETNGEAQEEEAGGAENGKEEIILVQDNAFTIKIQVPGLDAFDLQVTTMELVQEIHQMLMDKEETCHRTCFSLQLDGVTLDNFSELKAIEGIKEGSVIKLVDG